MVAPGELDHARGALARLATTEARQLRIESDAALEPGSCRLRGPQLEVTLELDRAVELVLGKL
jgi:hypothetical protein